MEKLVTKYAAKLAAAGLSQDVLVGGLDAELVFNRPDDPRLGFMRAVFDGLTINSLVLARPAEPYATVIDWLANDALESGETAITPEDCETRTFLHDLPVARDMDGDTAIAALKRRKSLMVPGGGVLAHGTVSPEQGFVTVSSVCFASFVLFFSRYLRDLRAGRVTAFQQAAYDKAVVHLDPVHEVPPVLAVGPFADEDAGLTAMAEAGAATVRLGLVDSYFGNISWLQSSSGVLWISQTGSSLDELPGAIDPCPLDGSSTACLTASSELIAHRRIYERTDARVILHGHPRFSVILSMDCGREDCEIRRAGQCHIRCPEEREVEGVPVVPGEVGAGPTGLCNTLPPAVARSGDEHAAIVYGHGLFTIDHQDYNGAFAAMLKVENRCRAGYFVRVKEAREG